MPTCTCGREIGVKPHCPRCGSLYTYGKISAARTIGNVRSRGFRCRNCDTDFHESELCNAPAIGDAAVAQQYSSAESINAMKASNEYIKAAIKAIENSVRANPEKLTQEYEKRFQKSLGISLSLRTGLPIVDAAEDTSAVSFDVDEVPDSQT